MQSTIETIDSMTRTIQRATKEVKKLQKRLNRLERRNTKVPRKLKKQLKKKYGQNNYLRMKRLGCFCKPYIRYNGYRIHPLLHFGGGRRSYLNDLLQSNKPILTPEGEDWNIHPIKLAPEVWKFEEFPDKFKQYFESVVDLEKSYINHIRDTGMPTAIIDWLHHKYMENYIIKRNIGRKPEIPFIWENWWTVGELGKGLSANHLLIDDQLPEE